MLRQLKPVIQLRKQFATGIKSAIQHDVNGIPWSSGDLLLDCGIDTLIMGINEHQGGAPLSRPLVFRWQTPSGREIRVMNGEHYTMFDQLFNTTRADISEMEIGVQKYLDRLEKQEYPHDFIYLTSTNIPVCWDNSPPNPEVAVLIKKWNDAGKLPVVRYVTPDELSTRIASLENLPIYSGDWTDYWNFGCASSAYETALNRGTKERLFLADFLNGVSGSRHPASSDAREKAWSQINIYDEHTWGNDESMDYDHPETRSQWTLKSSPAYEGRSLSEYTLVHELELFTGNNEQSNTLEGVLLINPGPEFKTIVFPVPEKWKKEGKKLGTARYRYDEQLCNTVPEESSLYSFDLEGYSWAKIPFSDLKKYSASGLCSSGEKIIDSITDMNGFDEIVQKEKVAHYIESPFYKLEFNPLTGRILSLIDKSMNREIIDTENDYGFFQLIREIPDPQFDGTRTSYYERDLIKMRRNETCWKTDWKAHRETPGKLNSFDIVETEEGIALIRRYSLTGIKDLEQTITLPGDKRTLELKTVFIKEDIRDPEALYFSFPLNLSAGWSGAFDTAGTHVKLDEEQLTGSCRDWVTVETYASIYDDDCSVLLSTPDAPMVMFGDFNYGRKSEIIPRNIKPLLLSWPMNSYWQTNFRASQPGKVEFHYTIRTAESFSAVQSRIKSKNLSFIAHPIVKCSQMENGCFLKVMGDDIELLHLKRGEDGDGYVFRLVNHSLEERTAGINIPDKIILKAFECSPFENPGKALLLIDGKHVLNMTGRRIATIKIIVKDNI